MSEAIFQVHHLRENGVWHLVYVSAHLHDAIMAANRLGGPRFWEKGVMLMELPDGHPAPPALEEQIHAARQEAGLLPPAIDIEGLVERKERHVYVQGMVDACREVAKQYRVRPIDLLLYCKLSSRELQACMAMNSLTSLSEETE